MSTGAQKSFGYDHPAYTTRQAFAPLQNAAGSGGISAKYTAHANLILYGLQVTTQVAGTSTYTYTQGGTATVAVAATQVSLIRVYNTASAGATIALATQTYGPYTQGGAFITSGTLTNQVGAYSQFQLNTNTGTAGYGGIPINAGDQIWLVNGTDATSVVTATVDYNIAPIIGGVLS
jgi:hypothetical protein